MAFGNIWKTVYISCLLLMAVSTTPINKKVGDKSSATVESVNDKQHEKKPKSLTINIKRPEPVKNPFDDTLTDDEAEVLIPKAIKRRMGRFLFDILDSSNAENYLAPSLEDGKDLFANSFGNLFNLNIDSNAVMTGVLAPENIAIHVAQNAVNFFSSSIAWGLLGMLTSRTQVGRSEKATTYTMPDDYLAYGTTPMPSNGYVLSSNKMRSSEGHSHEIGSMKTNQENTIYMNRNSLEGHPVATESDASGYSGTLNNGQKPMYNLNQEELDQMYEMKVQEYRRRKQLEQLRLQSHRGAESEQVQVISDRSDELTQKGPFRSHPEFTTEEKKQQKANQEELDRRLMKIDSYKKYLAQQQQQSMGKLTDPIALSENKNVQSFNKNEVKPDSLVKRKGPFVKNRGGKVRKLRKIKKSPPTD